MKMKEKKKQSYLSPELTVVQFRVERGYAASEPVNLSIFDLSLSQEQGNNQADESRTDGGYWGNGDENSWF